MEYDRLFEIKDGPAMKPGDKVVYDTAGGYTMCLNPLFIHYFPPVYVEHRDGTLFKARDQWDVDEFIQKIIPKKGISMNKEFTIGSHSVGNNAPVLSWRRCPPITCRITAGRWKSSMPPKRPALMP